MRRLVVGLFVIVSVTALLSVRGDEETPAPSKPDTDGAKAAVGAEEAPGARKELLTGTVQFAGPVLRKRGIKASEEMDQQIVLVTEADELVPLVADWRGRAFYQDERLRDRKVQLVVRRQPGIPFAQVLIVYTFDDKGTRMYTDYWCDICSIPMYEIKDCECCQGPIRLRFQDRPLPSYLEQELQRDEPSAADSSGK